MIRGTPVLVRRGPCCSCTHRFLILAIVQEFQNHVVELDEADVQALLSVTKIGNSVGRRIDFLLVSFDLVIQHQSVLNFFAMEVPVAHHLGAAQHICVERIRPVHILNRQSKVLKTEDTLPERCVVACCYSYYSVSTGCLGTDEICAASGRDRRAAYHPRNRVASTDRNASASLCQGDKIADWERSSQGRAAVQNSGRAKDRYGSFTSFPPSRRVRSALRADIRPMLALMCTHPNF